MTSVLLRVDTAPLLPVSGDARLYMPYEDELYIRDIAQGDAQADKHPPLDMAGVTQSYLEMRKDVTPQIDFAVERAGWLLAKEAVRRGFEGSEVPEDYIANQDRAEEVKQKASGFIGVAIDAYVLQRTNTI